MNETGTGMQSTDSSGDLSLQDVIGIVLDDWKLVFLAVFVVTALGGFHLWRTTPIYKVDALVQLEEKDAGAQALFGDAGAMFEIASPAEAEMEIIRSRMVLGRVVDALKLDIVAVPKYFSLVGKPMARAHKNASAPVEAPFAPSKAWGGERLVVDVLEVGSRWLGHDFTLVAGDGDTYELYDAYENLVLSGTVGTVGTVAATNTNATAVDTQDAQDEDTQDSQDVPDTTTTLANATQNKAHIKILVSDLQARAGTEFLVKKLPRLSAIARVKDGMSAGEKGKKSGMVALSFSHEDPYFAADVLNEIISQYVHQNVTRKSEEASKTLVFLEEQLPKLRARVDEAETRLNEFRMRTGTVDLSQEATLALNQGVQLETKMVELQQKREEMLRLYKANHPNVQNFEAQIERLQNQIRGVDAGVRRLPKNQQEFLQLSRDAKVATELYTTMLNNAQQIQVVKAGTIGNVRIVDTAEVSLQPVKPNKKSGLMLAMLLGGFVGVALALVRRLWNRGVEDPALVEKKLGLSVYATVPHSKRQEELHRCIKKREKGLHVLSHLEPDDLAVESFRSLRTTLHFSMMDAPNPVLLLAGPCPSIGKSFVSVNFATSLAMAGSKVLLIDGDMRRGHLHQYLNQSRGDGLADILVGKSTLEDCVRNGVIENLYFISTGTIPPNPSELLLGGRFTELLETAQQQYDYVLIDAPPVLAVTDASIIAKHAGTTLMLLKYGTHPMREIEATQQRLLQADANLKGVVFNDVDISTRRYGYGKYVYQYGYGKK
jgi:tyrosine-protein kinase Etk/Wzc